MKRKNIEQYTRGLTAPNGMRPAEFGKIVMHAFFFSLKIFESEEGLEILRS